MSANPNDRPQKIGVITQGALSKGVEMKLDPSVSVEDVTAGTFVVIQGAQYDFFSMITDARIEAANDDIFLHPPDEEDQLLRDVMHGTSTFATISLKPMLMLPNRQHQDRAERSGAPNARHRRRGSWESGHHWSIERMRDCG